MKGILGKVWFRASRMLYPLTRRIFPFGTRMLILRGPARGLRYRLAEGMGLSVCLGAMSIPKAVLDRFVSRGSCVFDIGANKGQSALILARYVGAEGQVLSFEPVSWEFDHLVQMIELNGLSQVKPFQLALSDTEGTAKFFYNEGSPTQGSFLGSEGVAKSITINTSCFDSFVESHRIPDFVKIDVEGAARSVLLGAQSTIRERKTVFYIELHSDDERTAADELLLQEGYQRVDFGDESVLVAAPR